MLNKSYNKNPNKVKYFPQKDTNEISNSITKNWTDQAMRCYLRNCNCVDCSISQGNYSFVCQMSSVVKVLLDQLGPPEKNKIDKLLA